MTNAVVLGITLGLAGVIGGVVGFVLCKVYRKRRHRQNITAFTGYDAVGDYKPPSLMSISTASQVFWAYKAFSSFGIDKSKLSLWTFD